jgi:N utilization substance protein B
VTRPLAVRRRSRRAALQALYAADVSSRGGRPGAGPDALAEVAAHFDLHERARAFADEIVGGVQTNRAALDARIAAHARNWRVERMAAVDRNVLRIATWELSYTDTPESVVIDEAIEIARDFGSEQSPAFVNGVLDAIARELRAERGGVPAGAKP